MKLAIGLIPLLFGLTSGVYTPTTNNLNTIQKQSINHNENRSTAMKITLDSVFGNIPTYNCKTDQPPTNSNILSYLKEIAPSNHTDVVDNIQIDNVGGGVVNFSAIPYSRGYTGSKSFNYTIPQRKSLKTIFGVSASGQTASINDVFNYSYSDVNTFTKFLTKLKTKYSDLDINQLQLTPTTSFPTSKNNSTNFYTVFISPIDNNNYYTEDSSFSVGLQFDGRTFNNFTISGGNFNTMFNSSATSQITVSNCLPTGATYQYSIASSYTNVLTISTTGVVTCTTSNNTSITQGTTISYTVTITASKSGYSSASLDAIFNVTVTKNTSTNWATITGLTNALYNKNYCISRVPSESVTLSAQYTGFTTGTTIGYSLVTNPDNALVLTGATLKPNTACSVSGKKTYTVRVTLSNSNYTNSITKDYSYDVRFGAKLTMNMPPSGFNGTYYSYAANSYSGYEAYKAFDSDTSSSWCAAMQNPGLQYIGYYPSSTRTAYVTGFAFRGYQGAAYYGPKSVRLDGTKNASTAGSGQTVLFSPTTSGLPTSNSQEFFSALGWNLDFCSCWLYSDSGTSWNGIADFYVYQSST